MTHLSVFIVLVAGQAIKQWPQVSYEMLTLCNTDVLQKALHTNSSRIRITSLGEWNSCNRMRGSDRMEPRPWCTEHAPPIRSAVKYEEEKKRDEEK